MGMELPFCHHRETASPNLVPFYKIHSIFREYGSDFGNGRVFGNVVLPMCLDYFSQPRRQPTLLLPAYLAFLFFGSHHGERPPLSQHGNDIYRLTDFVNASFKNYSLY